MSPLFSRKPKLESCFFCSELVEKDDLLKHYETHVFEVTDVNGDRAYTFKCPRCGTMDQAWGAGRPDDSARFKAACAVATHLMQSHSIAMV
jgi:hypothetical protein